MLNYNNLKVFPTGLLYFMPPSRIRIFKIHSDLIVGKTMPTYSILVIRTYQQRLSHRYSDIAGKKTGTKNDLTF